MIPIKLDLACYKDDSNISKNNTDNKEQEVGKKTDRIGSGALASLRGFKNNTDNKKQEVGKKTDRIGSGALASLRGFKQWKRENREKYEELMKKQKKEEEEEEEEESNP